MHQIINWTNWTGIELAARWKNFFQSSAFVHALYPGPRKQFNGLSIQLCKVGRDFKPRFCFVFGAGNLLTIFSLYCKNWPIRGIGRKLRYFFTSLCSPGHQQHSCTSCSVLSNPLWPHWSWTPLRSSSWRLVGRSNCWCLLPWLSALLRWIWWGVGPK